MTVSLLTQPQFRREPLGFGRMEITAHASGFSALGWLSVAAIRNYEGGRLIKLHRDTRDIRRVTLPGSDGESSVTLFLKRNLCPEKKHALSLISKGRFRSASDEEWRNLRRLERAGVNVCRPVAVGSLFGLLGERFSFIITEAAPGVALDSFAQREPAPFRRRRAGAAVAELIRKTHEAGLSVPGMYARHLFVDFDNAGQATATMIDIDRLRSIRSRKRDPRASELALLHLSVPERFATLRERLRVLKQYLGGGRIDRGLLDRVQAKIEFHRARKPALAKAFLSDAALA